jgi:hypothetical protein
MRQGKGVGRGPTCERRGFNAAAGDGGVDSSIWAEGVAGNCWISGATIREQNLLSSGASRS